MTNRIPATVRRLQLPAAPAIAENLQSTVVVVLGAELRRGTVHCPYRSVGVFGSRCHTSKLIL